MNNTLLTLGLILLNDLNIDIRKSHYLSLFCEYLKISIFLLNLFLIKICI